MIFGVRSLEFRVRGSEFGVRGSFTILPFSSLHPKSFLLCCNPVWPRRSKIEEPRTRTRNPELQTPNSKPRTPNPYTPTSHSSTRSGAISAKKRDGRWSRLSADAPVQSAG